jgi:hypothetical protein
MVVPFLCLSLITNICYLRSSVIRYMGLLAISAPIRPEGAIGTIPADSVVSLGATVKPKKTVGSGSAITWLTNAPTRLRRWICCRAILLLCPGRAIQLGGVAVLSNGLVDELVQPWRGLSFS